MAEQQTTNLKQAVAKAYVNGVVSEISLKKAKDKDGNVYIGGDDGKPGYVTVKTSDVNFIRFSVKQNELKKDGSENGLFKGIETIMNEYQSIAQVGEENATRVHVSGDINLYPDRNGNEAVGYRANFFNRHENGELDDNGNEKYPNKAEFEVEVFISSILPETNADGETGRYLVKGWVPGYEGRVEAITLVGDGEIGEQIESEYEVGQTALFTGEIINNRIEHIREIPMRIGKPKIEKTYENKNDLLIFGVSEPYEEGITQEKPYPMDAIRLAVQERKNRIEEAKKKAQGNGGSGNVGTSATGPKPSGASRNRTLGF